MPRGVRRDPTPPETVMPGPVTVFSHVDPNGATHVIIVKRDGYAINAFVARDVMENLRRLWAEREERKAVGAAECD